MADITFADAETRSPLDLTVVGGYPYAHHPETDVLVWGWTIGDSTGRVWSPDWCWPGRSNDIEELYDHIQGGGFFVAWNAFFDRHIWNSVMVNKYDAPYLPLNQVLCAQAQAEANNLPGTLDKAAKALGTTHKKDPQGKRLIKLLCNGTRADWDKEHETPEVMGHFRNYGLYDVYSMRDIWNSTRPLMQWEWDEYHASERINDRGVEVDHEFAVAAADYAAAEFADINGQLAALTCDDGLTLTAHLRKGRWIHEQLWPSEELQAVVTKPPKKKGGPPRYTCDRSSREALLELLVQPEHGDLFDDDHLKRVIEFLELIEAGNSAAVNKFNAIKNQAYEGRVRGQYSFNGAGQTGRFSSRGVQVHNLIRAPLDKKDSDRALVAIEAIMAGARPDDLVAEFGLPISRLLARLIRPTFIAPEGRTLVWADYDQIEGRVLPWLAATPQAEAKLDVYRSGKDVYTLTAAQITGKRVEDITDAERQAQGKVPELSLGFGGGVGALLAMARNYGVTMTEGQAKAIVHQWRSTNIWAPAFWDVLWQAALRAHANPGNWVPAARLQYLYHPNLMKGTLICKLPSGRWLVYPQFEHEWVTIEDDDGNERRKLRTSYMKGFSNGAARVDLWHGILAENATQAVAADFLRGSLLELEDMAVLHTHDELVLEVGDNRVDAAMQEITEVMQWLPDWAEGLPLTVTAEHGPYYTK